MRKEYWYYFLMPQRQMGRPQAPGARRALRLLAADPLPALPTAAELLGPRDIRRPGDLHEALPLSASAAAQLSNRAADAGVSVDVAATVLLEAALVLTDLDQSQTGLLPTTADSEQVVRLRLTAAEASYLRALTLGRQVETRRLVPETVAIPVRLVARVGQLDIDRSLNAVALEVALVWEIQAVAQGRTIGEWALVCAFGSDYKSDCSPTATSSPASSPANSAS